MGAHKHGSKGGSYVGGFLHLFDWNAKSRKKLFSSKSESPEQPKQTKRTDGNMPMTRFSMMDEDDMICGTSMKGSSDYSYATSITDEDAYATKPPGVVARLMGLDSLPTLHFSDTYSNPSFDSHSLTSYIRKDPPEFDFQMEPVYRPPLKKVNPLEKFQTETLPPKSAKPIPITRNKLLSPIKSSGFVSSSNPARIMESASKIPLVGPSLSSSQTPSIPLRVKISRDKIENSTRKPKIPESYRRSTESTKVKNVKSQQSSEPKRSISLALQAKANVQKREGLNHRAQPVKTPSNPERNHVTSNVLKQNNQKQNSLVDRTKSTTKSSCSRKPVSQKPTHKKEPYSTTRRKRSMEESDHSNNNRSNRTDVVSFTFTAPIARPVISNNASKSTSLTNNSITSDALSILLEQKLKELNCNPEPMSQNSVLATETEVTDDSSHGFSIYKPDQGLDLINKDDSSYGLSSSDHEPMFRDYEYRKYLFGKQPSPNSVLEPSIITESCNSSYTVNSRMQNSASVQARDLIDSPSPMDVDTELLDSASSIPTGTKWEPGYVSEVLANIETMFVDFTIGKTRKLVNPRVFDQLEVGRPVEQVAKLRREVMFDCVSECVETRCRVWAKGLAVVARPDRLAQEVYREIQGWEDMKDSMVDELVDLDMSGQSYKKWLDFDVEAFEIGVEIESRLLDYLIDEIVDDILVL